MPTNRLTDQRCKGAKPGAKGYKLFDGGGLFLFVSPVGGKSWRVAYRLDGKPKTKSLGPYPAVSLSAAREKLSELKALLREGKDPMLGKRKSGGGVTFAKACRKYLDGRKDISDKYRDNAWRGMERHLFPTLGGRDVGAIARDDLMDALLTMDAAGKHVYVRKVRMWASQVFEWAHENGHAAGNPAALIRPDKAFGKKRVESFAALEPRDVPEFLRRLSFENDLESVLACRMLAFTWTRTVELRMMEWSEIDGDLWIIPEGKMKRRLDHLVPLSRQALAILDEMRARRGGSRYVFPASNRLDRPMSENAILYLIARIGYQGRMTGHGWRTIASTWANERGFKEDAIERQLAHVPKDRVRATYNRAKYLPIRRRMMQKWADWLMPG